MKLAVYDFDGTLCDIETLPFIIKYYGKGKYSKIKLVRFYLRMIGLTLKYKLKLDASFGKERYRAAAATTFMYLFDDMKKDGITKFFTDCASEIIQHLNPKVLESIKERKEQGYHIVLCSGANTLLLGAVVKYIEVDTVIGTELHFHEDGFYNFEAELMLTTGKNKPIALLEKFKGQEVDWKNSYAYGDSYYDYDVMTLTGNPVAVNPDQGLREIADKEEWEILGEE